MRIKQIDSSSDRKAKEYYRWINAVSAWRLSGQSMRSFCLEQGLSYSKFQCIKKQMKMLSPVAAYVEEVSQDTEQVDFVPVNLSELEVTTKSYGKGMVLILKDGHQIWLPHDFEERSLLRLLYILGEKSC